MKMPRRANVVTGLLLVASVALLVITALFNFNIQVLKNWKITLPNQPIHAGDTITIQSTYTKLRSVTGVASRYIECKDAAGTSISYPLNIAKADRPPGVTGTGVVVTMPSYIQNLPTPCKVRIVVSYKVYPWRTVTESNESKEFTLLPIAVPASAESSTTSKTSPVQPQVVSGSAAASSSSSQSTPTGNTNQPVNSQTPVIQKDEGLLPDNIPIIGPLL